MDEEQYNSEMDNIMAEYAESKDESTTDESSVATDESQETKINDVEESTDDKVEDKPQDEELENQEEATDDKAEDKPAEKKKTTGGINKKINKLTAQRRQAEREQREARAENLRLKERLKALESASKPKEGPEPKIEDFDSLAEYQKDLAKREAKAEIDAYKQEQQAQAEANQELVKLDSMLKANEEKARTIYEDYDEVIRDFPTDLPMSDEVRKHLAGSPAGALTMYNMTCNEDVVNALNNARNAKEVERVIATVHDNIWRELKSQSAQPASIDNNVEAQPQTKQALTPPKSKVASTPPKQGKTGSVAGELQDLEGDSFFDEFSKVYS